MRQGCVMSPGLFNIFMDGCVKEVKCKVGNTRGKLRLNGEVWSVVTCLFVDNIVLLAESEGDLQRVVNEFYSVCKKRKLQVNTGKSKVMVFERREEEVIGFITAYRIRLPAVARCRIMLGSEKMEEVNEFKYLGTVPCASVVPWSARLATNLRAQVRSPTGAVGAQPTQLFILPFRVGR